jgi:DNA polymerase elongation subunit (family B)
MIERAANFGTKLFLGREGRMLQVETMKRKYRLDMGRFLEYEMPIIPGRECIDTLLLAYKSDTGKRYESYGLKWLIKFEKLEQPNRVFYDASKIRVNYKIPGEMEKIKAYAERDADDGLALFKLLITPYYYMCTFIPMTLSQLLVSASGSQLDTSFVSYYLCHGHSIPNTTKKHNIKGALSFGNPGIYKNVWSFDLASMHPSIIIQYRVSDPKKDPLEIIWNYTKILRERRFYHKKMGNETGDRYHKDMDKSLKILINSIFGMQGTEGLCFNNPKGAEFILWMSRKILTTCMDWAKNDFEQVERDKISYDQGKYVDWLKGDFT